MPTDSVIVAMGADLAAAPRPAGDFGGLRSATSRNERASCGASRWPALYVPDKLYSTS